MDPSSKTGDFTSDNDSVWERALGVLFVFVVGPVILATLAWVIAIFIS